MGTVKYTGPVASFHCPTNAEIRSLKVHFSPKQEGTGDPSPSNVRPIVGWDGVVAEHCGKNLFDKTKVTLNYRYNGDADLIYNKYNCISDYIPVKPNTNYYLSNAGNLLVNERCVWFDADKNVIGAARAYYGVKVAPSNAAYIRITVHQANIDTAQFEEGSTATQYEPYCGSTTNYTFGVLGKNKFDGEYPDIKNSTNLTYRSIYVGNQIVTASSNMPKTTEHNWSNLFILSGQVTSGAATGLNDFNAETSRTITPIDGWITIAYRNTEGVDPRDYQVQLELGSTATTYEPYDPNHTVYGGWVDLISGEVCEEWWHCVIDALTNVTFVTTSETYIQCNINPISYLGSNSKIKGDSKLNVISEYCKTDATAVDAFAIYNATNGNLIIRMPKSTVATANDMEDYIEEHNLSVCFKLATPNTYSLAPTQLQTFLGTNNVWSNADYVEVEYDLHETQDILARKNFIMASQPHVEEASGAIATFNTDMASPLKECKVHFSPVQEGTGDPSPENVRPITGWTGIEVYRTGKNLLHDKHELPKAQISSDGSGGCQIKSANVYKVLSVEVPINTDLHIHKEIRSGSDLALGAELAQIGISVSRVGSMTNYYNRDFNTGNNPYAYLMIGNSVAIDDPELLWQLEIGSTATAYEPYSGTTLPIDWSDSAGTVYGGYVDLVNGEVWKTHEKFDCADYLQTTSDIEMVNGNLCRLLSRKFISDGSLTDSIAEKFASFGGSWAQMTTASGELIMASGAYVGFSSSTFGYTTKAEWLDYLTQNHIIFSVKLPTPILLTTLDPITFKTLRGTNNVWSSANGNIELSYWKH